MCSKTEKSIIIDIQHNHFTSVSFELMIIYVVHGTYAGMSSCPSVWYCIGQRQAPPAQCLEQRPDEARLFLVSQHREYVLFIVIGLIYVIWQLAERRWTANGPSKHSNKQQKNHLIAAQKNFVYNPYRQVLTHTLPRYWTRLSGLEGMSWVCIQYERLGVSGK